MKIVTFTGRYNCFIAFYCSFLVYLIPCHVLSIMMFKCTLMKEQINFLKIKSKSKLRPLFTVSCCSNVGYTAQFVIGPSKWWPK